MTNQAGLPLFVLRGHEAAVAWSSFSPSGNLLVSCDMKGAAILWNMHTFLAVAKWQAHDGQALCCPFLTDSVFLTESIVVWNANRAAEAAASPPAAPDPTMDPALAPKQIARMEVLSISFCPCEVLQVEDVADQLQFLVSCPSGENHHEFDVYLLTLNQTGPTTASFATHSRQLGAQRDTPAAVGPLGLMLRHAWVVQPGSATPYIMAGYESGQVVQWGWTDAEEDGSGVRVPPRRKPTVVTNVKLPGNPAVTCLVPDVKAKVGVAGTAAHGTFVFELWPSDPDAPVIHPLDLGVDFASLSETEAAAHSVHAVAFRGDNKRIACGMRDGSTHVFARSGKPLARLAGHSSGAAEHVVFGPGPSGSGDNWRVAVSGQDSKISVWACP
ncbi:Astra associated protein 1 Asa1 [Blastocladiella emersonii ATCC 22665]|nr:Astra associated protein 1 Asa1 [Blastocladiella emersonii ATCC 22665]